MKMQMELFDQADLKQSMDASQKASAVKKIVEEARLADKFFYSTKEVYSILHCSRSELYRMLGLYRLDAVLFRNALRIPWYDLAAFILLDSDDTIEEDYYDYFRQQSA